MNHFETWLSVYCPKDVAPAIVKTDVGKVSIKYLILKQHTILHKYPNNCYATHNELWWFV